MKNNKIEQILKQMSMEERLVAFKAFNCHADYPKEKIDAAWKKISKKLKLEKVQVLKLAAETTNDLVVNETMKVTLIAERQLLQIRTTNSKLENKLFYLYFAKSNNFAKSNKLIEFEIEKITNTYFGADILLSPKDLERIEGEGWEIRPKEE